MKLSTLEATPARHICIYGPPKIGKTRLAGRMAEHGYDLDWLDLESGSNTLFSQLSPAAKDRINLIRIPDTKEWPVAIETCLKISKFITSKPYRICDKHGKIECPVCSKDASALISELDFGSYHPKRILVVDSTTQLSSSSINQITKGQDDLYKLQRDDYANQGLQLNMFLTNVQACRFNVICITHEISHETEEGKEKIYPLAGTRNFSRNSAKYFDDVVYLDIFNRRHRATTGTTAIPLVLTGSRSGIGMEGMQEPDLLPLFTGELPSQATQAKAILQGAQPK